MRFLLCVDETSFSEQAIEPVRRLAEPSGADVHLLHVAPPAPPPDAEPYSGSGREAEALRDEAFRERTAEQTGRLERRAAGR